MVAAQASATRDGPLAEDVRELGGVEHLRALPHLQLDHFLVDAPHPLRGDVAQQGGHARKVGIELGQAALELLRMLDLLDGSHGTSRDGIQWRAFDSS